MIKYNKFKERSQVQRLHKKDLEEVFQFNNAIKRYENKNNKNQYFIAATEKLSVLVFIFPVGNDNPNYKTDKKNESENKLTF